MINLWIGKTISTFADNWLKDEEAGSGSAADRIIDKKGRSTIEPDPFAPSSEEPTTLPLALGRIHKRLSNPKELKKLHLQHHHMTTDQFRFRTRSLHLPKSTFDPFDKIRSECEVCQAAKHAPSRSKTSGLRADTFGDMTLSSSSWNRRTHHCFCHPGWSNNIAHCRCSDNYARSQKHHCPQELFWPAFAAKISCRRSSLHDGDMGTCLSIP